METVAKLIDTHCHLDAAKFDTNRDLVVANAIEAGVQMMVVPSVLPKNYVNVITLSQRYQHCCYALGMHPIHIDKAKPNDIKDLNHMVDKTLQVENKLVAIGEIGLDFFITKENKETQEYFFSEQLKIAKQYDLPVILHVRGAIDDVLKHLRRVRVRGGIAHAFNGSMQQAEAFIKLGFKLGFGGAMTYTRALKLRKLAKNLPLETMVLETDAPDMPPAWLKPQEINSPQTLLKIAKEIAVLRRMPLSQIIEITSKNSREVLPKMVDLCT
ncbi:MAG: TatD family hydrolase [Methylophilaceae bacterium]